ncbi:MarR family transcriptional regulator [Ramlibacter sp. XY19]|uniref:MarR family winged helix-turn-helix transcriptional regulator n=1 Tax=Ramlibacter paludis TaxID=2908000 RepID=UPI0023DAF73F|nr:MarR family transcriptional regulator [Ramlibacter paludis]MCG2592401.1 MarR family transcriptional regulator [Ramlibacter paludis]
MAASSAKRVVKKKREVGEDLYEQPGHLIRRAHQIAQGMFDEHVGREVTPIQYAILRMVHEIPGIDQVGLAKRIALDTSTTATAAARLEGKGLLTRSVVETNRRQLQLHLTADGEKLLDGLVQGVHRMRSELLGALEPDEREHFIELLRKFVHVNNEQSRAPLQMPQAPDDTPPPAAGARPARRTRG